MKRTPCHKAIEERNVVPVSATVLTFVHLLILVHQTSIHKLTLLSTHTLSFMTANYDKALNPARVLVREDDMIFLRKTKLVYGHRCRHGTSLDVITVSLILL